MKNYIKGIATGAVITAVLYSVPAFSEGIEAFFNTVNIRIEKQNMYIGETVVKKDDSYTLSNGDILPYSINYKDTVYLPLRKIGELTNKDVSWDSYTQTVTIEDSYTPPTFDGTIRKIEKPDKNGIIWTYSLFESKDGSLYLKVNSSDGETHTYLIDKKSGGTPAIKLDDDGLTFVRLSEISWYTFPEIVHLPFLHDEATRNGEVLNHSEFINVEDVFFDGDYFYLAGKTSAGLNPNAMLVAINTETLSETKYLGPKQPLYDIQLKTSDENSAVFHYYTSMMEEYAYINSIAFNKAEFKFGEPVEIGQ